MATIKAHLVELVDFLENLEQWQDEFETMVKPLHPDDGVPLSDEANEDVHNRRYDEYYEAYNDHLESLHDMVKQILRDTSNG